MQNTSGIFYAIASSFGLRLGQTPSTVTIEVNHFLRVLGKRPSQADLAAAGDRHFFTPQEILLVTAHDVGTVGTLVDDVKLSAARLETHNCAGLQSCSAPRPDARLGRKRRRSKPTARQHRTPVMAAATASTPGACSPEASRARNSKATSLATETLLSGAVRRRWLSPSMSGFDSAHSWGGGSMQLPTRWELCGTLASRGCTRHVGQQPGGCAQRCVVLRVGSLISRQ